MGVEIYTIFGPGCLEEPNQNLPPNRLSYCSAPSSSLRSVKAGRRETLNIEPGYSSQQSIYQSLNHQYTGNKWKIDETGYDDYRCVLSTLKTEALCNVYCV